MNKQRLYKYNLPLCLLPYSGVQHILCFVLLRLVHPMLPVCLDCAFLYSLMFIEVSALHLKDQLHLGGQFYWWRKLEFSERKHPPAASD